jgi:hypothetical protein
MHEFDDLSRTRAIAKRASQKLIWIRSRLPEARSGISAALASPSWRTARMRTLKTVRVGKRLDAGDFIAGIIFAADTVDTSMEFILTSCTLVCHCF